MQLMIKIPSVETQESSADEPISLDSSHDGSKEKDGGKRKIQDINEWAIVEMQGDLESRFGDVQLEGKFVGDLHFTKAGQIPVLIIGHHILYGKVTKLEKPFVIMEKCQEKMNSSKNEIQNSLLHQSESETNTVYNVRAIIRKKLLFKARPKAIIANVPKKI